MEGRERGTERKERGRGKQGRENGRERGKEEMRVRGGGGEGNRKREI